MTYDPVKDEKDARWPVGRIEFGPSGRSSSLTSPPKDGKVGLFVPIPDLTKAADMLDFFGALVDTAHLDEVDVQWSRDEIKAVVRSLRGKR